jgi:hypothetical protein
LRPCSVYLSIDEFDYLNLLYLAKGVVWEETPALREEIKEFEEWIEPISDENCRVDSPFASTHEDDCCRS